MSHFSVHRSEFFSALSAVTGAIEKKNTIPVLSNVLIRPKDDAAITLTATNLSIEVTAPCPAVFDAPFTPFTLTGQMLQDFTKRLPESAEMAFDGAVEREVTIRSGRARVRLMTLPADDFPLMDTGDLPHAFELPAAILADVFSTVGFAMSVEETRFYLRGVFLHPGETGITAVATDGHRLARRCIDIADRPDFAGIIVPDTTVNMVAKAAAKIKGEATVSLSPTRIVFDLGRTRIASKLVEGTFPDYQRVIPQENGNVWRVPVGAFAAAVDRVAVIGTERGHTVTMAWDGDTLALSAVDRTTGQQSEDAVAVEPVKGEAVTIGINARYALDVFSHIAAKTAAIAFNTGQDPAVVTPVDDDSLLFVLMPMRV